MRTLTRYLRKERNQMYKKKDKCHTQEQGRNVSDKSNLNAKRIILISLEKVLKIIKEKIIIKNYNQR